MTHKAMLNCCNDYAWGSFRYLEDARRVDMHGCAQSADQDVEPLSVYFLAFFFVLYSLKGWEQSDHAHSRQLMSDMT